ncbi:hypothetical protein NKH93_24985 [Mesorhizobium sp. M0954]|uniref:hypothetical protein n=1 Tax=Mesorhizobium sp. M0954 TaxID=2957032 RepID=UPI00333B43C9
MGAKLLAYSERLADFGALGRAEINPMVSSWGNVPIFVLPHLAQLQPEQSRKPDKAARFVRILCERFKVFQTSLSS